MPVVLPLGTVFVLMTDPQFGEELLSLFVMSLEIAVAEVKQPYFIS